MKDIFGCFFYGSLVNRRTWLEEYNAYDAELRDWSRTWHHRVNSSFGPVCAVTAKPHRGERIQGVLILCSKAQLSDFDHREEGYRRVAVRPSELFWSGISRPKEVFVYISKKEHWKAGTYQYPLWLSYIECILAGFAMRYGDLGVDRFIQSTDGWSTPILHDRGKPRYSRKNRLGEVQELVTAAERTIIDARLNAIEGAHFFRGEETSRPIVKKEDLRAAGLPI